MQHVYVKLDSDSHFCQSFAGIRRECHAALWLGITFCCWAAGRTFASADLVGRGETHKMSKSKNRPLFTVAASIGDAVALK